MSEKDTPTGGSGPFDQEQYNKLLRCVREGKLSEWNNWVARDKPEQTLPIGT